MTHIYKQISSKKRDNIVVWKSGGSSNQQIAKKLGRSVSTIGRELKRNRCGFNKYTAIQAQIHHDRRAVNSHRRHPLKNPVVYSHVLGKLRCGWSPEIISWRLKKKMGKSVICPETIYSFIYKQENQSLKLWEKLVRGQKQLTKELSLVTGKEIRLKARDQKEMASILKLKGFPESLGL